jgi:LysM repeat protein
LLYSRRRRPRKGLAGTLAIGAAILAAAPTASAAVNPKTVDFENGSFSNVSQTGVLEGSLSVTSERAYDGRRSAKATYNGSTSNGYARTIDNISWPSNADVWYGAAYYLPSGYASSLRGGNDIMRWDNWGNYGSGGDYGAIEFWSTDRKARFILGKYSNDPSITLGNTFSLPEGRWFWLEVHQRFSTTSGRALTDVYVDGRRVSSSTRANTFGRPADRLRTGIVAIADGRQSRPLTLYFDRVKVSTSQSGPLGGGTATRPAPKPVSSKPAPSKPSGRTVTVRRGDTLSAIAARYLGRASRWPEIARLNGVRDPRMLRVGQVLRLPAR